MTEDRLDYYRAKVESLQDDARAMMLGKDPAHLADEEVEELERIAAEVDKGRKRIAVLERVSATTAQLAGEPSSGRRTQPLTGAGNEPTYPHRGAANFSERLWGVKGNADARVERQFYQGFFNSDRQALLAMGTTVGPDGGYSVPSALAAYNWNEIYLQAQLMQLVTMLPMETKSLTLSGFDSSTAASSSLFGGITAQWVAENATATEQSPKMCALHAQRPQVIFLDPDEQRIARGFSDLRQPTVGGFDGRSRLAHGPRHFARDGCRVSARGPQFPRHHRSGRGIRANQRHGQLTTNIIKMWARLHPACAKRAVWVISPSVVTQLYAMVVEGTSNSTPVYLAGNNTGPGGSAEYDDSRSARHHFRPRR